MKRRTAFGRKAAGIAGCVLLAGCQGVVRDPAAPLVNAPSAAVNAADQWAAVIDSPTAAPVSQPSAPPASAPASRPAATSPPALETRGRSRPRGSGDVRNASWRGPIDKPFEPAPLPPALSDEADQGTRSRSRPEMTAAPGRRPLPPPPRALLPEILPPPTQAPPRTPSPSARSNEAAAPLTLEELQRLAVSRNPTLRQALALVQQAQGNWIQGGLYPNPVVGYTGSANNNPFDAHSAFISQNIVTGSKLEWNRAVAGHDVHRAQWEAQAQNLRVLNEIAIRYAQTLGAQRRVSVVAELVKIADEGVSTAEKLLDGEQVSRADVLQAQLQRSQARILLRDAQFQEGAAWRQLSNAAGTPNLLIRPLDGRLEEEPAEIDQDAIWRRLFDQSPQLQAARARVAAAAAQVEREKAQPTPDIQLSGSVGRDFISSPFTMYGLQVGVTLPVHDRNQGNVLAAQGDLHAAQAEVARLELALRDRLADALRRHQTARNASKTYRETILPTAETNVSLTRKGYEEGELDFLRVLTARRDFFEANVNYVSALVDLKVAAIEIQGMLLTGGLEAVAPDPVPSNAAGQTTGPGN